MTLDAATLVLHFRIVSGLMAALVVVNVLIPRRFRWSDELSRVSLLNRQIFQAHTAFIVLLLALFSALFFTCADALMEPTRLSRTVLVGLTIFWAVRMLMQWFFYSPALWRGDRFNTLVHGVFSVMWVYVTGVCASALWLNLHLAG